MDKIAAMNALTLLSELKARNDDDFTDRLSSRYTTVVLLIFAAVVTTGQYVGEPIKCWSPAHFADPHSMYVDNYCWIKNTYYLPFEDNIPRVNEADKRHMVSYYQWIPIMLVTQALLFFLPCILWRSVSGKSGIDTNNVVSSGETLSLVDDSETRMGTLAAMCTQMDRYLLTLKAEGTTCTCSIKHCLTRVCFRCCGRRRGNYLTCVYFFIKLMYLINVIAQLLLMVVFFGDDFRFYGFRVLGAAARGEEWRGLGAFPRVTMCDFRVRRLGNTHRYTVQCVLALNLFNEMVFLFLWWWFVILAFATGVSFIMWLVRIATARTQHSYVAEHLKARGKLMPTGERPNRNELQRLAVAFVSDYLHQDGVFVLRLLGHNTQKAIVRDFIGAFWEFYLEKYHPVSASGVTSFGDNSDDEITKAPL